VTLEAVARALAGSPVFAGLEASQLDGLARECRVRRYAKGEQVFARGDSGGGMFLVLDGSVALTITSADGGEVTLAVLKPPQSFGELAVIDDGPRVATATARRSTLVLAIPRQDVRRLLREVPEVSLALLTALASVVRQVDDHASDLVLVGLAGRVAKFLAATADGSTVRRPDGLVPVDLRISQAELAGLVGGSRQQVNRVIVSLEASGAIQRDGSRIVAVRPRQLALST
jgi:CRP-like cAMP-binding protein